MSSDHGKTPFARPDFIAAGACLLAVGGTSAAPAGAGPSTPSDPRSYRADSRQPEDS